jgi:hypothetical protein
VKKPIWFVFQRRAALATTCMLFCFAFASAQLGYAQATSPTINAQPVTGENIALTAAELGPEWSMTSHSAQTSNDGTQIYRVGYSAPSGRQVHLTTAVATPELAEAVVSYLRYGLNDDGFIITSVQSQGFGDGRSFRAQATDGSDLVIAYLFRVHNLLAIVFYSGAASAGDLQTQATGVARKQEAKFFAVFAPPPTPSATSTPTPVTVPTPTPAPTSAAVATATSADPTATPDTQAHPAAAYCGPDERPRFRFGFATLSTQLGPRMGNATSCEYGDPRGSGDTLQNTEKGLSFYRLSTNTATFTTGFDHWALTPGGLVYWTGGGIDPPDSAVPWLG